MTEDRIAEAVRVLERHHAQRRMGAPQAARNLTDADVDAIAEAVAERIHALPRYLDTAAVAEYVDVSTEWVRGHAAELGAIRIGDSPRGPLRFERSRVERALDRRRLATEAPARVRRRPGPRPRRKAPDDVELIPLPDRGA